MSSDDALIWLHSLDYYHDIVKVMGDYDEQRDYVGAEGDWRSKIIPRTIWGIDINIAAYIHDYNYTIYKGKGEQKRFEADAIFLADMMKIIELHDCWRFRRNLARMRAVKYFSAVREGGKKAFNS
jgi:hypothetical protein